MKRIISSVSLTLSLVFCCVFSSVAKAEERISNFRTSMHYNQTEGRKLLNEINSLRLSKDNAWYWSEDNKTKIYCPDLEPLKYDYTLEKIAMQRAAELAINFSNYRPNGKKSFSIFEEYGLEYLAVCENVGGGYISAKSIHEDWAASYQNYEGQSNRRNMLSDIYKNIGVGHLVYNGADFWVEILCDATYSQTYVPPIDKDVVVSIDIETDLYSKSELVFVSDSYSVKCGQSFDITAPVTKLTLKDGWPQADVFGYTDVTYSTEDTDIISLTNEKVTGLSEGAATIKAVDTTGAEKLLTVNVTPSDIPLVWGDINNDDVVTSSDSLLALQHSIKKISLNEGQIAVGDVNLDKRVDSSDALFILQYSVKKIKKLPVL